MSQLGRDGDVLRLCATDGTAGWTITLGGGGFSWRREARAAVEATATVRASAGDLLLYLYGRYRAHDRRLAVRGDRTLVDAWSSATRYQGCPQRPVRRPGRTPPPCGHSPAPPAAAPGPTGRGGS
ncbi:hypothetical protein [Streptomyces sp. NRRL S-118]|uniref:hypothetical protein n=1 Tax=Streptomyces sp. NRRL S-118 TaxID=1463881 RepID=UPI0004C8A3EB|nr:hypothetical protein [Streptomyces sp. NRRL S-118]